MPVTTEVVVDADLLAITPSVVRGLADRDVRVARALLQELSERAAAFAAETGGSAFATVRQRVARGLLDGAVVAPKAGGELVVSMSQQELADAVGTVREVVVRSLRGLRRAGLIETRRHGIRIGAYERLLAEAYPEPGRRRNIGP